MTTATSVPTTSPTSLIRAALMGAVGGVLASLMMAAYAMIAAATYQGSGFFTPLYHIASTFISPDDMMSPLKGAMGGSNFEFFAGPAIPGALVGGAVVRGGLVFAISSFVDSPWRPRSSTVGTRSPTWPSSWATAPSSSST